MSRTISGTLRSAIDSSDSYTIKAYIEVAPSRIFFDAITSDFAIAGADAQGVVRDPMKQMIGYNTNASALSTFVSDTVLKYANQGSATVVSTAYSCTAKPGVFGSKIYIYNGTTVARHSIDWALVTAENADPLTADGASITPATSVVAVHGVSTTEAGVITNNDGGFTCIYMTGSTQNVSTNRFMFPKRVDWDGSGRTMLEMGIFSGALKLGNKIFFYISNASFGSVEGMYYDTDTAIWSDVFTVVPTDLDVSLCELLISNAYTHNGTAYLVGQFSRTDFYEGAEPYTLVMQSSDGMTFSIDRFSMVSDLGYRFLALVGADNKLYLGNCNRVCYAPVTWVFDGASGSAYTKETLTGDHIKTLQDSDLQQLNLEVISGDEDYFDSTNLIKDARLKLYVGYITGMDLGEPPAPIEEYVLYGTYLIDQISYDLGVGQRGMQISALNEAQHKLTGLSMPFYAEIFGKSCLYDPMTATSGKLYTAPGGSRTETKFQIDFWKHEAYSDTGAGITGISMISSGGVSHYQDDWTHKYGIIVSEELKDLLDLTDNPTITATSVTFKLYGWSHPVAEGGFSDIFDIILETEDEDGVVTTTVTNEGKRFPTTWPSSVAGTLPIEITMTGLTVGHKIRRIGVQIWNSTNGSWFNVARVEVASAVEVPIRFDEPNTPWTVNTDGTFSVPSGGRPFVMFAQKPYNAYNFNLIAFFELSVTSWTSGFPVADGLVGHAYDGGNFILGRYNRTNNKVEIVKVRNGIETTLVSTSSPFTVPTGAGSSHGLMFSHKDGKYTMSVYRPSSLQFEQVTSYTWKASDGFQYTDRIATMKCGIYGQIGSPIIKLLSYMPSGDDNKTNAEGIPVDPMYTPTTLPTTGTILVGDKEFTYSGRVGHPTVVRGPYQFRQSNVYTAPYGNGSAGLECRDFDWTASTTLINNYLISIDSGASFVANGALWQSWNKTGGVVQYLYNRARYYSANGQIANVYHTLSNKVWVTGYLQNITQVSGPKSKIQAGTFAQLKRKGNIKCFWYAGAGGSDDTTISDLVRKIAQLSGAKATFSGDYTLASLAVSGVTNVFEDNYAEGFDFSYETASATTHTIKTNIKVTSTNYENGASFENDTGLDLVITHSGSGVFKFQILSTPSNTQLFAYQNTQGTGLQKFRVLFFENNMSVYQNGRWIFSFAFDELQYDQSNLIDIDMDGTLTVSNIVIKELGDWREAVYIDLETDGRSAIGSVLQERPIEIHATPDGGLDFTYLPTRAVINAVVAPIKHRYDKRQPTEGASDAIVYGSKDVKTLQYNAYAKELGFSTKLVRLPNLNVGAVEAARMMLLKSYEQRVTHQLQIRADLSLTPNDVYHVDYTAAGTSRAMEHYMIVESIGLSMQMTGQSLSAKMNIRARETTA